MGLHRTLFCAKIQQRWVLAVMGSLGLMNAFAMRTCMSMAMTEMVKPTEMTVNHTWNSGCPELTSPPISAIRRGGGIYEWDEYKQGLILSSFYFGYGTTLIPGGLWSRRFGGKYVLGSSILLTAILTFLTPMVVKLSGSTGLMVLRFLTGMGEGPSLPAMGALIAQWAPSQERTRISTMVISGIPLGTALGTALSRVLMEYSSFGWPLVFYFFGSSAVLWFLAWVLLCHSRPDLHPFITEEEKDHLRELTQRHRGPTPWCRMMASGPLWALLFGHFGFAWGLNTMTLELPKYASSTVRFSILGDGLLTVLPHLSSWVIGNASSWVADWLTKSKKTSRTTVRKLLYATGAVLSAIFLLAASYAGCDRTLVSIHFTVGVAMSGFFYPSLWSNAFDLSPNFSSIIFGLLASAGTNAGSLASYITGVLTPNQTLSEWRIVFWITLVVYAGSSLVFVVWGDGEVQTWNNPALQNEDGSVTATVHDREAGNSNGRRVRSDIPTQAAIFFYGNSQKMII